MADVNKKWRYLTTKYWEYTGTDFRYPEEDFRYLETGRGLFDGKEDFGIVISGGGTRSATAGFGQLRGLRQAGILQRAKYLSCNSGGSWVSVPFTFYQGDDDEFFSPYLPPDAITEESLKVIPDKSFLKSVTKAGVLFRGWSLLPYSGDESLSKMLGRIFLKRLRIPFKRVIFSLNRDSRDAILEANPRQLGNKDFVLAKEDRPYLIVNGTLHNRRYADIIAAVKKGKLPQIFAASPDSAFHIEMTPLYAGVKVHHPNEGDNGQDIGGGYVEPMAFDGVLRSIDDQAKKAEVRLGAKWLPGIVNRWQRNSRMFTLADMMAISGSALSPADEIADLPGVKRAIRYLGKPLPLKVALSLYGPLLNGMPEINHWSIRDAIDGRNVKTNEYNMGDGGQTDNIGLIPLLARGVKKAIVFINTPTKLKEKDRRIIADAQVARYFGLDKEHEGVDPRYQVLEDEEKYKELVSELFNRGDGAPIFESTYQVKQNNYFGVSGNYEIDIMWVYLERCMKWEEDLPANISALIGEKIRVEDPDVVEMYEHNLYEHFPNYWTFLENFPRVIDLEEEQANLLANYTTWVIDHYQDRINAFLSSN